VQNNYKSMLAPACDTERKQANVIFPSVSKDLGQEYFPDPLLTALIPPILENISEVK